MSGRVDQDLILSLDQSTASNARVDQDLLLSLNQATSSNARVDQDLILVLNQRTGISPAARVDQDLILVIVSNLISRVVIGGGPFIDAQGNPLSNGTLLMQLSQDAMASSGLVVEAIQIQIALDVNGNIAGTPLVWPTTLLTPPGLTYKCWVQSNTGTQVWGPHNEIVTSGGSFNISNWTTPLP